MSTAPVEDKKVLRKLRKAAEKAAEKEKKNALARALHSQPLRKINTQGLQCLRKSLGLLSNSQNVDTLDAIFIAIDFECSIFFAKTGRIRLREVGISTLDTRDIGYKNPDKIISSQH